ncbi:MAG: biotin--[acetyl-CoA-carboxylase] ligase [Bacteroidetes bacterium]|nr:MAG: biotin--[acetyl-CoA-carboxylase] ligase [Bacteroidota bacterium]
MADLSTCKIIHLETLNTLFVGKVLKQFSALPSTNEYAIELLSKNKPPEGTVILTPNQFAGRGQIGNGWESEPGKNITLSVLLYPAFLAVSRQFLLNQTVAVALKDCLAPLVPGVVSVKWPNDIYIGHKKVCGTLIQNTLSGAKITSSVVGIGINVNQTTFQTNPPNPTSLALETGQTFDLETLQNRLFQCLEQRYLQLKTGQTERIERAYLDALYRRDEMALFRRLNEDTFFGKIRGVTPTGKLIIEDEFGHFEHFAVKEIRFG